MQEYKNLEKRLTSNEMVHDAIIGMSDGLTVPFALAAGIASAVNNSSIIIIAGISAIVAGCISMGLGGYLAATNDIDYYCNEQKKEFNEIKTDPNQEKREVIDIFKDYGLTEGEAGDIIKKFESYPDEWVKFMMANELKLPIPHKARARNSALTIAISYFISGFIPLFPYILIQESQDALLVSIIVTLMALVVFGYIRAKIINNNVWRSIWQTVLISGLAAGAAYVISRFIA